MTWRATLLAALATNFLHIKCSLKGYSVVFSPNPLPQNIDVSKVSQTDTSLRQTLAGGFRIN